MGERAERHEPMDAVPLDGPVTLPYDPDDWQRKLERARERRAEVLRGRGADPGGKAPAKLRALPNAAPPPGDQAAPRETPDPERRAPWTSIGALSGGVALLCVGIAIGMTLAGFGHAPQPAADAAPATAVVRIEPAASSGPQVEGPAAVPRAEAPGARVHAVADMPPDADVIEAPLLAVEPEKAAVVDADPVAAIPAAVPRAADPSPSLRSASSEPGPSTFAGGGGTAARLVVHAPPSVGGGTRDALAGILRAADLEVGDTVTVPYTIGKTHLRYYHASDEGRAAAVAALLGVPLRDFTSYRPSPQAGMIEVWMAGSAP